MDDLIKLEERKAQGGEVSIDGLKTLEYLEGLKDLTNKQREAACRVFNVGSLEMVEPRGAYYGFFKVKGIEDHETERRFAKELLEKRRVHLVPGKGFEYPVPGYFRMVFLDEADNITRAGEVVDKFAREEFDFNL